MLGGGVACSVGDGGVGAGGEVEPDFDVGVEFGSPHVCQILINPPGSRQTVFSGSRSNGMNSPGQASPSLPPFHPSSPQASEDQVQNQRSEALDLIQLL